MGGVELQRGLKTGGLFRALFRTNPSDRTQAFCTLPGLPSDIFVRVRGVGRVGVVGWMARWVAVWLG